MTTRDHDTRAPRLDAERIRLLAEDPAFVEGCPPLTDEQAVQLADLLAGGGEA